MGEDGLAFLVDAGGIVRVDSRRLGDDVPLVVLSLDKGGLQLAPKFSEDGVVILGARIVVEKGDATSAFVFSVFTVKSILRRSTLSHVRLQQSPMRRPEQAARTARR